MIGRMVAAPSSIVSSRPRRWRSRSVKIWPRSKSAASWTSSMARKATSISAGIASTVQTQKRGLAGDDLLFAGDEGGGMIADPHAHAVINFAGKEPERQPDHARALRQ